MSQKRAEPVSEATLFEAFARFALTLTTLFEASPLSHATLIEAFATLFATVAASVVALARVACRGVCVRRHFRSGCTRWRQRVRRRRIHRG
jgi:hypothetical protein